jgi:hypothetical protein
MPIKMPPPFLPVDCSAKTRAHFPQVTREQLKTRTRELALLAGRLPAHVLQKDYEEAKRELTGESDWDRQEARIDAGFTAGAMTAATIPAWSALPAFCAAHERGPGEPEGLHLTRALIA